MFEARGFAFVVGDPGLNGCRVGDASKDDQRLFRASKRKPTGLRLLVSSSTFA
jgi:hypothetical protein